MANCRLHDAQIEYCCFKLDEGISYRRIQEQIKIAPNTIAKIGKLLKQNRITPRIKKDMVKQRNDWKYLDQQHFEKLERGHFRIKYVDGLANRMDALSSKLYRYEERQFSSINHLEYCVLQFLYHKAYKILSK